MSNNSEPVSSTVTIVVMGVSGCGKSTVAQHLADELNTAFKDGDELHPPENIQRMSDGIPLTDADREPWLHLVKEHAKKINKSGEHCVIACSALRKSYRDILRQAGNVWFVHLTGSRELIAGRMHLRTGHFMPEALLDSQIATLEPPTAEEKVITVAIEKSAIEVAQLAASALQAEPDFLNHYALSN